MLRRPIALLFLLAAFSAGAANTTPVNLDFESGSPGQTPPGWSVPDPAFGYTTAISTDAPKQGRQCVRVSGRPSAAEGRPSFGNVMQQIDATPYRGKFVRLRGAVRVEGARAAAGLWMRVDLPSRATGFFDNMDDRPIRSPEWTYHEITGEVAADATVLNIGMLLKDEGTAWLDDVSVEIVAKPVMRSAEPKAITPRGLENLVAFTRLFGLVRHFHPSDEAAAANWDAIAVNGAERVEGAKDATELATRLGEIFLPIAPTLRVYPSKAKPPAPLAKPAGADTIVAWEHYGFGTQDQRSAYRSERIRRKLDQPDKRFADPLQPHRIDLGGGVTASVPLAVFADASRTLPAATRKAAAYPTALYTGNDRATRIGGVVILWNVLQHFYPYFDVVEVDWPAELRTALRAAGTDRDEAAFHQTLRRMVAAIDDGHGSVQHSSAAVRGALPILWRAIGDALVVTVVAKDVKDVQVGDAIVAIDGKPVLQALAEAEGLISGATPQWRRSIALRHVAAGNAPAALTIRNADGSTRIVTLARGPRPEPLREKRPEKVAEVKPGIWYVDLDRISDADFSAALAKLAAARGIIFDLRGYPRNVDTTPLRHMINGPTESARWNIPIVRRPNREALEWDTRGRWELQPLQPRLPKNIAFLTDGRAISYAESWMGIIEAYKLAAIVGEATAGTNGNVNVVSLPGGYRVAFTGMKVLKHDGSRHHGVGIIPTVPVSPTVAGIREGRDEQLEKAIEILER